MTPTTTSVKPSVCNSASDCLERLVTRYAPSGMFNSLAVKLL